MFSMFIMHVFVRRDGKCYIYFTANSSTMFQSLNASNNSTFPTLFLSLFMHASILLHAERYYTCLLDRLQHATLHAADDRH